MLIYEDLVNEFYSSGVIPHHAPAELKPRRVLLAFLRWFDLCELLWVVSRHIRWTLGYTEHAAFIKLLRDLDSEAMREVPNSQFGGCSRGYS